MTRTLVRLAAVFAIAACTAGCSTISDLMGDDTSDAAPAADASGFPPDTAPTNADGTKPDLAAIPDKPTGTTSPDAQRATTDSLAADAARSHYSSDALRGGTEAAAAPPPPPSANPAPEVASNTPPAPTTTPSDAAPAPDNSSPSAEPPAQPAPAATTAPPAPSASAATPAPSAPEAPSATPPAGTVAGAQPVAMSDAALGFKPSAAPPLDPSISQFVAPPIIARYQETAANAGVATGPIAPLNASAPNAKGGKARTAGGPSTMSGAVVANLGAPTPSVYANAIGGAPQAVVLFPGDGTAVTAAARAQIRSVVAAFRQRGANGYIKVVGHSSSRTANMPIEKHLMTIFAKSQARANSVAKEIIREGVPASHVLVEAVGDSQPVYYESMPQGEAGNRRAEIFIQG